MEQSAGPASNYDPHYFAPLFAIEDRHFWFRARNRVLAALAGQVVQGLPPAYRVLEVGCGTGNVLRVLEQVCPGGTVVGMDLFAEGLAYARRRCSCALVQGDMIRPPFADPFDLVGLFDVLEHISDDRACLRQLHPLVRPGGALLLTVPADPALWSAVDEAAGHFRRYCATELAERLAEAGFRLEYMTPYMAGAFPLVWLKRRLLTRRRAGREIDPAAAELTVVPVLNGLLSFLLRLEVPLIARRRRLPVGTSLLAVARRA